MDGTVALGLAGIGATLIVGLAGTAAVLVVARWQREDAKRHRFMDMKRLAYTDFLALIDELETAIHDFRRDPSGQPPLNRDFALRYRRNSSQVTLIAPGEVRKALVPLLLSFQTLSKIDLTAPEFEAAREACIKGRGAFTNAVRRDLGIFEKADERSAEGEML